jgi:hypothetical protein
MTVPLNLPPDRAPLRLLAERPTHGPLDHPGRDPLDKVPHPTSALAGPRRLRVRVLRRERVS